jgi:hypothetical protein
MFEYNQIIEYIDGTRDLNYEEAKRWASSNNAKLIEGEYERKTIDGKSYLLRKFTIVENPEIVISEEEQNRQNILMQINTLKNNLKEYDYIGVKIATGCATIEEYSNQIAQCQEWRKQINDLENELKTL